MPVPLSQAMQGSFSASQRQMVDVIEAEFRAAGYPQEAAAAAVVNAVAESGLNPRAAGDGGKSIGLFQLHEKGGGKGMTVAQRQDPRLNTRRIIEETQRGQGLGFYNAIRAGERDVAKLAGIFSYYVERPKDKEGERARRMERARQLFPARFQPSTSLPVAANGSDALRSRTGAVRAGGTTPFAASATETLLTAGAVMLALVAVAATAAAMKG
jgi:hypothetical protein